MQFLRGTLFPDSRHLAGLKREQTHWFGATLEDVHNAIDGWHAGWVFHNWLDDTWNEYFYTHGLAFGHPEDEAKWLALKLLAEKLAYKHAGDVEGVRSGLAGPYPEAVRAGASEDGVEEWYAAVREYMSGEPSAQQSARFLKRMGFTSHLDSSLEVFAQFEHDAVWQARAEECGQMIEEKLANERVRR